MKGDFTRITHDRRHGFTKVLLQQGRASLDADWNEQADIQEDLRRLAAHDVIGPSGVPVDGDGFRAWGGVAGADVGILPGRIWVEGLLCETGEALVATEFPADHQVKVDRAELDGRPLHAPAAQKSLVGEWVELRAVRHDGTTVWQSNAPVSMLAKVTTADNGTRVLTLQAPAAPPAAKALLEAWLAKERVVVRRVLRYLDQPNLGGTYTPALQPENGHTDLVYLDVWQRHVTHLEQGAIRDPALGGPDTATRVQTFWQVRARKDMAPCDALAASDSLKRSRARLTATHAEGSSPPTPCEVGEAGGYTGLENRLYRFEVHGGGTLAQATFKWSRDNGSVCFAVEAVRTPAATWRRPVLTLKRLGRDQVLTLQAQDWVELVTQETEEKGEPGRMARVERVDEGRREVELLLHKDATTLGNTVPALLRLRRWDHTVTGEAADTEAGLLADHGLLKASQAAGLDVDGAGMRVTFTGSDFRTGDWWVVPARTATGKVEGFTHRPPMGEVHHHCPLGTVKWGGTAPSWTKDVHDCRPTFAPLTAKRLMLRALSGDGQEAGPSLEAPCPVEVLVEDQWGRPAAGVVVRFSVDTEAPDDGDVKTTGSWGDFVDATTDADGLARATWRLGPNPGPMLLHAHIQPSSLPYAQASAPGVRFRAVARYRMRVLGGDGQHGRAGQALPGPLKVVVEDPHGRPIVGKQVAFGLLPLNGAAATYGTLNPPQDDTDANGIAETVWTLGASAQSNTVLEAEAMLPTGYLEGGTLRVRWQAQAVRTLALRAAGGDGQETGPGMELLCPVGVIVEDQDGRPVPDVQVIFDPDDNHGEAKPASGGPYGATATVVTTTPDGLAEAKWKLGATLGCQRLKARLASVPSGQQAAVGAVFHATASLVVRPLGGDGQEAVAGEELPCPIVVAVEDVHGRPLPSGEVEFAATGGGGRFDPPGSNPQVKRVAIASGRASVDWVVGAAGPQEATASAHGHATAPKAVFRAVARSARPTVQGLNWVHGSTIGYATFAQGLQVTLSDIMKAGTVRRENLTVSVEVPLEETEGGAKVRGHYILMLDGDVTATPSSGATGTQQEWKFTPKNLPHTVVHDWVEAEKTLFGRDALLCRVHLRASHVVNARNVPLDGTLQSRPGHLETDPADDDAHAAPAGFTGGDLESWFRLAATDLQASLTADRFTANGTKAGPVAHNDVIEGSGGRVDAVLKVDFTGSPNVVPYTIRGRLFHLPPGANSWTVERDKTYTIPAGRTTAWDSGNDFRNIAMPASAGFGHRYWLTLEADNQSAFQETNESNNVRVLGWMFRAPQPK